jgi:starch-binding outer membrane protein SusE/F
MNLRKVIDMKRYLHKLTIFSTAGLLIFSGCTKENKVNYNGGTAPVLTSTNKLDTLALPIADSLSPGVSYYWTNPNFMLSTGPSSQNVTYYLEFDTAGAGFSSPTMQTVAFTATNMTSYTIGALNSLLANGLQVDTSHYHNIQVRVSAFLQPYTSGSNPEAILYSDTLNFTAKPYLPPPAVVPPVQSKTGVDSLYIVGSAVNTTGWDNPIPPAYIAAQTFTKLTETHFQITIPLIGGEEYKLINQSNGSWTDQWSVATADSYPNGGPFVYNGANCIAPAASGTYLIDVNFQTGIFTVTAK